jgi:purine-binding chemotaxis protein CheW
MSTTRQYCTFFLGDFYFGVDVQAVQEVIRFQEMTPVPLASDEIKGLINLRGQIVTAIDLRTRLDLEPAEDDRVPMNVVVRANNGVTSLLVDKIGDVIEVDETSMEKPPETLGGDVRNLIFGAHKLEDRLLLILDTEQAARATNSEM